jgi:hypothetical protein
VRREEGGGGVCVCVLPKAVQDVVPNGSFMFDFFGFLDFLDFGF